MSNKQLIIGSIKKFLTLSTKSVVELSDVLQVLQSKVTPGKQNGNIYTVTLSDSNLKFERFFMPEKAGGPIKDGDLIEVKAIQKCISNGKIFFKVMKFEVVDYSDEIIGEPHVADQESIVNLTNTYSNSATKQNQSQSYKSLKETKEEGIHKKANAGTFGDEKNHSQLFGENYHGDSAIDSNNKPTKEFHYKLQQLTTFTKDLSILVRCMKKSEKRTYKTSKGVDCTVFNFTVMDSENTEMQISCFGKIAEKFCPVIIEGKMYEIIGGYVKVNDHKYNITKADYQINLNEDTKVIPIEDTGDICDINPELTGLDKLNDLKIYSNIDFIALVINVTDKNTIKTKKGNMLIRKLVIVDDSEYKVDFTLWKSQTEIDLKVGDIIFVTKGKIGEYSGKNISASDDSHITINPTFKSLQGKVNLLRKLYYNKTNNGQNPEDNINSLTTTTTKEENENTHIFSSPQINAMEVENLDFNVNSQSNEKPKEKSLVNNGHPINISNTNNTSYNDKTAFKNFKTYQSEQMKQAKSIYECKVSNLKDAFNDIAEKCHKVKVYITQFNHSDKNFYAGCPKCKKKLQETNENTFKCPTCNVIVNEPSYYYTVSFRVKDCTSDQFVDCYGPVAEKILNVKSEEYKNILSNSNLEAMRQICNEVEFQQYIMIVKARTQNYNNLIKKKLGILSVEKANLVNDFDRMAKFIELSY